MVLRQHACLYSFCKSSNSTTVECKLVSWCQCQDVCSVHSSSIPTWWTVNIEKCSKLRAAAWQARLATIRCCMTRLATIRCCMTSKTRNGPRWGDASHISQGRYGIFHTQQQVTGINIDLISCIVISNYFNKRFIALPWWCRVKTHVERRPASGDSRVKFIKPQR